MTEVLHFITQAMILVLGLASRWVTGRGTLRAVRTGLWISIVNCPAWFYFAWETGSWSLAALNTVYAVMYVRAVVNVGKNLEER